MNSLNTSNAAESVNGISLQTIRTELQRMSSAQPFRRSPRLAKFLSFTAQATAEGKADTLKEYSIGVQVFSKPVEFDPRLDSIVRVEARRLRAAVERYYANEGADSPIRIVYRVGSYAPSFHKASEIVSNSLSALEGSSSMMVLVGSPEVLQQVKIDLERRYGLVPAGVAGAVHSLSASEAAALAATRPGEPVFRIGRSPKHVNGVAKPDGAENAI